MECTPDRKTLEIVLAGNPNVGKSVVFNQLTGMSQVIGNWPGKTVKKAEGTSIFQNYEFKVVDLPGIYNLSAYSLEEIVSREYIIQEKPDFIVNVIDSNRFERNLYFTLQLLMLNRPMVICLNQYDLLTKRGYEIDTNKLSEILGVPVVKTVAVHNRGIHEILEEVIQLEESGQKYIPKKFPFGKEIEEIIQQVEELLKPLDKVKKMGSKRFASIKLLEADNHCYTQLFSKHDSEDNNKNQNLPDNEEDIKIYVSTERKKLEDVHGEQISTLVNSELFKIADEIEKKTLYLKKQKKGVHWSDILDHLTMHSFFGYLILALILLGTYVGVFQLGGIISEWVDMLFESLSPGAAAFLGGEESFWFKILWNGFFGSFMGGVGGVLPFVIPFFFIIEILQDTGYLPRAAYLMDNFMHKLGIHGKSIIPILLGFGCNVPAMTAAAIMENEQDRKRSILISSMIPCSAVSTIVLGLVAANHGILLAILLYVVNFVMIIFLGRILTKAETSEITELIIEIHDFRKPNFKVTLKQTWHRSKEFIVVALPLIVILGGLMEIMLEFSVFTPINVILSPVIVYFLGLPMGVGVYLFYGVLRKELNLVLLEVYVTSLGISMVEFMTPIQMVVFCVITMLYIPCLATILAIKNEVGKKYAFRLSGFQILLALLIAGLIRWIHEAIVAINFGFLSTPYLTVIATFVVFFMFMGILLVIIEKTKLVSNLKLPKAKNEILDEEYCE